MHRDTHRHSDVGTRRRPSSTLIDTHGSKQARTRPPSFCLLRFPLSGASPLQVCSRHGAAGLLLGRAQLDLQPGLPEGVGGLVGLGLLDGDLVLG